MGKVILKVEPFLPSLLSSLVFSIYEIHWTLSLRPLHWSRRHSYHMAPYPRALASFLTFSFSLKCGGANLLALNHKNPLMSPKPPLFWYLRSDSASRGIGPGFRKGPKRAPHNGLSQQVLLLTCRRIAGCSDVRLVKDLETPTGKNIRCTACNWLEHETSSLVIPKHLTNKHLNQTSDISASHVELEGEGLLGPF
jgi:hypothetical protein